MAPTKFVHVMNMEDGFFYEKLLGLHKKSRFLLEEYNGSAIGAIKRF